MADWSVLVQEPAAVNATAEIDGESLGTGPQGKGLRRERLQLAGHLLAQIAEVLNGAPAGTEYALVVRPIPSAAAQPISAASLPLPAGASTEATLALIKAKTDNLDVLLSTRTKPTDVQKVDGSAVTQPVSGTFFQATQPVSAAALPLPAGAATETTLGLIKTDVDKLPADPAREGGNLALVAKDATLGTVGPTPGAYTVLDRLAQVGLKLDAVNATMKQLVPKAVPPKASTTLLHRS